MKQIRVLLLLLLAMNADAQNNDQVFKTDETGNTLLWQVSGNGLNRPSFLFGTFHLYCKDDIHLSEALKQALANCHVVYLELDLKKPSEQLGSLMLLNMKDGKKLKDLYSAEEYKKVSDYFKDTLKISIDFFQQMKPELLSSMMYPQMMPCRKTASIEDAIVQLAGQNNIETRGLETVAFQSSIFDSIPYSEQATELLKAIDSLDKLKKYFNLMLKAYQEQRLDSIAQMITDPAYGSTDYHELLLDNRNKNWVNQLKTIMQKEPVFTAVGAGHLVGENGLIALLRAEGYTVKGLKNK